MDTLHNQYMTFRSAWVAQARSNPWITAGFAIALLAVIALLIGSAANAMGQPADNLRYALYGGFAGFAATAFGALLAIGLGGISARLQDSMLGGGYYRGAAVLLSGAPGTAKTTLCGSFVLAACARGERALFVGDALAAAVLVAFGTAQRVQLEAPGPQILMCVSPSLASLPLHRKGSIAAYACGTQCPDGLILDFRHAHSAA